MRITLVGMGSGAPGGLTVRGLAALQGAGLIIGARRLLRRSLKECSPYFTRTGISLSCSNPPALQLTAVRAFHMD